jgi:hypothetical protein
LRREDIKKDDSDLIIESPYTRKEPPHIYTDNDLQKIYNNNTTLIGSGVKGGSSQGGGGVGGSGGATLGSSIGGNVLGGTASTLQSKFFFFASS